MQPTKRYLVQYNRHREERLGQQQQQRHWLRHIITAFAQIRQLVRIYYWSIELKRWWSIAVADAAFFRNQKSTSVHGMKSTGEHVPIPLHKWKSYIIHWLVRDGSRRNVLPIISYFVILATHALILLPELLLFPLRYRKGSCGPGDRKIINWYNEPPTVEVSRSKSQVGSCNIAWPMRWLDVFTYYI